LKDLHDLELALADVIGKLDSQILSISTSPQRCHELKLMRHALHSVADFIDTPHTDKINLT